MKIVIPDVPPSLNRFVGRENTWAYRAEKQRWTGLVKAFARRERARTNAPQTPRAAHVQIAYFFPDKRRRDPDNYCGKLLLDGLTQAGVIADDDFAHIALTVRGYVDAKMPRTEITVTGEGV